MAVAGFVIVAVFGILDAWLHVISISDDLYQPAVCAIALTSVSVGHLDHYRIPPPAEVAMMQMFGIVFAGGYMIRDLTGSQDLTVGSTAAAIIVLVLNAVVGAVVLPRDRTAPA